MTLSSTRICTSGISPARAYPWLGPAPGLRSTALRPDEVAARAGRGAGVDAVVLVQAADNAEDTGNMFSRRRPAPEVVGIVAWVPLDRPERPPPDRSTAAARSDVSSASGC